MMITIQQFLAGAAIFSLIALGSIGLTGCNDSVAAPPASNARNEEKTAAESGSVNGNSVINATRPASGQAISVQTIVPVRRNLVQKFSQPGVVEAAASADLFSRISGYVKSVNVDIGDTVEAGQILLEVDVPELQQELSYKDALVALAEAELAQTRTAVDAAEGALETHSSQLELAAAEVKKADAERNFRKREFERYAALAADKTGSPQVADEKELAYFASRSAYDSMIAKHRSVQTDLVILKAKLANAQADVKTKMAKVAVAISDREKTRVQADYARLKAPYSGTIIHRNVDPGEYVHSPSSDKATPPFTIAGTQSVTIVMRVPEKEVPLVRLGNPVSMKFDALRSEVVTGIVARIARSLEEKSRTMRVEIDVKNPGDKLYPGMFGSVSLVLSDVKDAQVVPASALYGTSDGLFVVTVNDGLTRRVRVQTGYDDGRFVQILSGLTGDEEVIVSNKGNLADGQQVVASRVSDH